MNFNRRIYSNDFLDKTGAAASWLCAVHCLAMPFVVSFLPFLGLGFLADEKGEYAFLVLSAVLSSVSLLPAFFKLHRKISILLLFVVGIFTVAAADTLFEEHLAGKIIFVAFGAGLMTAAHLFNRRLCRACLKCEKGGCRSLT